MSPPTLDVALRHTLGGFALDAAFTAPAGVTALFGPSGSGKTTVANAVAGLLRPDAGHVRVAGDTLLDRAAGVWTPPHRRRIGCVFQESRLFPHLTVRQNLAFGRWFAGADRRPTPAETDRVIALLGLEPLLARRPGRLSGGETQRVAIGRAMLSGPRLLIMDEPLAALDAARKAEILPYLERLRDEAGIPILYVSHAVSEIARLAAWVVLMRDGRVLREGPAATLLSDPATVPALGVRDAGAVLPAQVLEHDPDDGLTALRISGGALWAPLVDAPPGARLTVRIAAQDVIIATERPSAVSALNVLPCVVEEIREGLGPGAAVALRCGEDRLLARVTRRSARSLGLAEGQTVFAVMKSVAVAPQDIGRAAEAPPP